MKPSQVNKLYSKLTPHEQAALAFEAAVRLNGNEVDAILEQVERKTYITLHADYHRRAYGLQFLAGQYGIEYWKNRALMLLACDKFDKGEQQGEQIANQFFNKTVALELALIEVCKQLGVDVEAIKKMAGCLPDEFKGYDLPEVDSELIKQYVDMFSGLIV
ncbi:MAG: hypothetical protein Q8Q40_16445 [Methylococcaceae bacterium]|nr:hypothetical protein [Methylococcaceae bacterium]MDP3905543.1 hypothetical protein [Methylococcaceae bacterium]